MFLVKEHCYPGVISEDHCDSIFCPISTSTAHGQRWEFLVNVGVGFNTGNRYATAIYVDGIVPGRKWFGYHRFSALGSGHGLLFTIAVVMPQTKESVMLFFDEDLPGGLSYGTGRIFVKGRSIFALSAGPALTIGSGPYLGVQTQASLYFMALRFLGFGNSTHAVLVPDAESWAGFVFSIVGRF